MKAEIKAGMLIISIPVNETPMPSASGKTLIVATSGGNQPVAVQVNGQALRVGVNAYISNARYAPPAKEEPGFFSPNK